MWQEFEIMTKKRMSLSVPKLIFKNDWILFRHSIAQYSWSLKLVMKIMWFDTKIQNCVIFFYRSSNELKFFVFLIFFFLKFLCEIQSSVKKKIEKNLFRYLNIGFWNPFAILGLITINTLKKKIFINAKFIMNKIDQ